MSKREKLNVNVVGKAVSYTHLDVYKRQALVLSEDFVVTYGIHWV